jgi:hypothetical protein
MRWHHALIVSGSLLAAMACVGGVTKPSEPQTAEAFCSSLPNIGFGNLFYCASSQTNLQTGLPNGWLGYCITATRNLGLVGYSAVTFSGGAFPVQSQSDATNSCNSINVAGLRQCGTIVRCTRQ